MGDWEDIASDTLDMIGVGLGVFDRIQWVVFPRLKPLNATN